MSRVARALAATRRLAGWLRARAALVAVVVASLAVVGWYLVNTDRYVVEHPDVARGDGEYRPAGARGDGHMVFLLARSLVFDGDVNLDDDLRRFGDPFESQRTSTGYRRNTHAIGTALVWAPALALAQGLAAMGHLFGADVELHGYTPWHLKVTLLVTPLAAGLAVLLAFVVARRRGAGELPAAYAAVAILLGSPLVYYAALMPSYTHAVDAAAAALFLFVWQRDLGGASARRAIAVGAALGLAALVRHQNVLLGAVLLVDAGLILMRGEAPLRHRVRGLAAAGGLAALTAMLVFVPQLVANQLTFGTPLPQPVAPDYVRPGHPFIVELLFASRGGWISMTPLVGAGLLGLVAAPRGQRAFALGLALALGTQIYMNATPHDWWGGAAFGSRRMCSMTLPVVIGLAWLLAALGRAAARWVSWRVARHALALAGLGWFVIWNLAWASRYTGMRTAGTTTGDVPMARLPGFMRAIARPIVAAIGNPFALPASVPFAIAHGVPVRRFTELVGDYPLASDLPVGIGLVAMRTKWRLLEASGARYVAEGVGPPVEHAWGRGRELSVPRARLLLPLLEPIPHTLDLPFHTDAAVPLVITWEGQELVRTELPRGLSTITVTLPFARVGELQLVPGAPGVVLGQPELAIDPHPSRAPR